MPDVRIRKEGQTLYVFEPLTDAGKDWIKDNTPDDSPTIGDSLVVEHRYAVDLAGGMLDDGLELE